jgi:hypothetical protein
MKSRIICLAPGRAVPGMTLAASIIGADKQTLLSAGTVLDSEMLERLIRRGIEAITILLPDTRDEETIARETEIAQSRVNYIFRESGNAAKDQLRTSILNYRMENAK